MNGESDSDWQTEPGDAQSCLPSSLGSCLISFTLVVGVPLLMALIPASLVVTLYVAAFCLFSIWALLKVGRGNSGIRPPASLGTRGTLTVLALAGVLWAGVVALEMGFSQEPQRDTWLLVGFVLVTVAFVVVAVVAIASGRRQNSGGTRE
jgi:hypothetical protein